MHNIWDGSFSSEVKVTLGEAVPKNPPSPYKKGAGGIFPNDPIIRHANSTRWRPRASKLYAWRTLLSLVRAHFL